MIYTVCDACGKPAEFGCILTPTSSTPHQHYDICRDCYNKVRKIITGMEVRDEPV